MDTAVQLTVPVAPHNQFDASALAADMFTHVAGFQGGLQVSQFKGGQSNPTGESPMVCCCLQLMRWSESTA